MALVKQFSNLTISRMEQSAPIYNEKCFHAFFIYRTSKKDRELVYDLVQELEQRGFRCGYHEKDFIVGETVTNNLERNFQKSLKVIVVLSNEFFKSQYCYEDLQIAFQRHLEKGDQVFNIIPLLFGIHENQIPFYLRTRTYLDVSGPKEEWLQRFIQSVGYCKAEETRCLLSAFADSLEKMTESAKFKLLRDIKQDGVGTYTQQMGRCLVSETILKSRGIYIKDRLNIDLSSLEIKEELIPVYNEYCKAKNIKSKLKIPSITDGTIAGSVENKNDYDEGGNFGEADCSITFYGFDEDKTKSIKFAFSFSELTESGVTFSYRDESIFEFLRQTVTDLIHESNDGSEIQYRSKKSKKLRRNHFEYMPYFQSNRNNYRRIRLPFQKLGICARVTVNGRLCYESGDPGRQVKKFASEYYTVLKESTRNKKYLF